MGVSAKGFLLMDASVVADFCDKARTAIRLVSEHLGQTYVTLPVLYDDEAPLDPEDCADFGIVPVEPSLEIAVAAARRRSGLTFHDHLCLLLARENGWSCVTDDGCLRRACRSENLPAVWSHELIALLVDGDARHDAAYRSALSCHGERARVLAPRPKPKRTADTRSHLRSRHASRQRDRGGRDHGRPDVEAALEIIPESASRRGC
jgi:hypothetical protein